MKSTIPLTVEDLDAALRRGCQALNCDHKNHGPMDEIFLRQKCCPGAGLDVRYQDGKIFIACRICQKPVAVVVVAERK